MRLTVRRESGDGDRDGAEGARLEEERVRDALPHRVERQVNLRVRQHRQPFHSLGARYTSTDTQSTRQHAARAPHLTRVYLFSGAQHMQKSQF